MFLRVLQRQAVRTLVVDVNGQSYGSMFSATDVLTSSKKLKKQIQRHRQIIERADSVLWHDHASMLRDSLHTLERLEIEMASQTEDVEAVSCRRTWRAGGSDCAEDMGPV